MKKTAQAFAAALMLAISLAGFPIRFAQAATPAVPSGYALVDLMTNGDFENASASLGFAPSSSGEATLSRTTVNPISGAASLKLDPLKAYGRVDALADYAYGQGPIADSVTFAAKLRVDAASSPSNTLQICTYAYLQTTSVPLKNCQDYPVNAASVVDVHVPVSVGGQQLDYVFPRFALNASGTISATVDDAHLYVVQKQSGTATPPSSCAADTWSCTDWNACSASGTQARSCTMTSDCAGVVTPSPATTQACSQASSALPPGTLIKRADQPAVYYYASNGRRYVFPNENTFKTWYAVPAAFSSVRTVTAAELASILLGGSNVTYRGGFKMLKIQTDPKVYAVAHGGVLRPIASEQVAAAIFGTRWSALVDDISDAFFTDYKVGAPINAASDYDRAAELAAATSVNGDKAMGDLPTSTPPPTPPDGNGAPAPGGGGASAYPGYAYHLPAQRPFISLQDFSASVGTPEYTRFKNWVDKAVDGPPGYGYTSADAVIMYGLSGQAKYIDHAIAQVEAQVKAAESDMAAGCSVDMAADSYLDAGWYLEQLAFAYDRGYDKLTAAQRTRWAAYAEQALYNIWNPQSAKWGGRACAWSGWSIDNPGNNYFFSFMRATQLWALASQNQSWFAFLQTKKFPPLADYYAKIPGGGSREGTGYGTAHKNLFELYRMWKASTGENLGGLSSHEKDTIDFWVNSTVPTLNKFAPIGDLSRESQPNIYEYHENLVKEAVMSAPGTDQAKRGVWWLNNNSVETTSGLNLRATLLKPTDAPMAPTALSYYASGTGNFFTRSGWTTDALWMSVRAGAYDESHAHQDQGSFSLYKADWLTVTSNIWSKSGLQQETDAHNGLRFVRSNGTIIPQNYSTSTMSQSTENGVVTVDANLAPAYSKNASSVQGWTRQFVFNPQAKTVRVKDACQVASGIKAVFQLHVPTQPATQADGSIKAGNLVIRPGSGMTTQFVRMSSVDSDFQSGWRIDITNPNGCSYNVELAAS